MNGVMRLGLKFFIFAIFLLWPAIADAHAFSRSLSTWRVAEDAGGHFIVNVVFLAPVIASESIPYGDPSASVEERFFNHVSENIGLKLGEAPCHRGSMRIRQIKAGQLRADMRFQCLKADEDKNFQIHLSAFFDDDPVHIHFARFYWRGEIDERLFSDRTRRHLFSAGKDDAAHNSGVQVFASYIPIGVLHILSGLDHLAFLAALLLVCRNLRLIFWAVTGFTLGHSLTLGLAAAGVLSADEKLIEALIGFTILLVALEGSVAAGTSRKPYWILPLCLAGFFLLSFFIPAALSPLSWGGLFVFTLFWGLLIQDGGHMQRLAPFLSVLFGLIHGFGFASVLTEAGLPRDSLLPALAGFNIGVEAGQLGLVIVLIMSVWGVRHILSRWAAGAVSALWDEAPHFAFSLLAGLGVYWFIGRAFL